MATTNNVGCIDFFIFNDILILLPIFSQNNGVFTKVICQRFGDSM